LKILFLGLDDSPVVLYLRYRGEDVTTVRYALTPEYAKQFDWLISYGYRCILKKDVLDLFPDRAINLHTSFLPWNRGADPNYWSWKDDTPKGVTIHYIDEGIDTGDIIVRESVDLFNKGTLRATYAELHVRMQCLFVCNWHNIKSGDVKRIPQPKFGSCHRSKDMPKLENGWDTLVKDI
jgi:methionyl-tRNA formyltransferase